VYHPVSEQNIGPHSLGIIDHADQSIATSRIIDRPCENFTRPRRAVGTENLSVVNGLGMIKGIDDFAHLLHIGCIPVVCEKVSIAKGLTNRR